MNVKRRFNVLKWKIIIIIVVVISVDVGSRNEAEIKRILGPLIAGYVLGIALARSQKSHQNSPRKIFVVSPYPLGFFKKKNLNAPEPSALPFVTVESRAVSFQSTEKEDY